MIIKKILVTSSILFLLIIGCILYGVTIRGVYGNPNATRIKADLLDTATKPFELSPERGRFVLTYSLAEHKSFALDRALADSADPDVGYFKGKYYVYFAPGISILALPFYMVGKYVNLAQVAAYSVISIFAILNLLAIYYIARKIFGITNWASLFAAIIFGFGSTSWSYANTLYQHQVTVFFILSSFIAAWLYAKRVRGSWIYASYIWFACGYAILIDYPNVLFMAPVIIYFFYKSLAVKTDEKKLHISLRGTFALTSLVFAVMIFLHGYYNYVNFGDWKKVSGSLIGISTVKEAQKQKNVTPEEAIAAAANKKSVSGFFKEEKIPMSFSILTLAPDKGIFIFSPIFILAFFGIYRALKKLNAEHVALLGTVLANIFLYSSWGDPWGGWAYGPRYLIPSMAILAIYIAYWLQRTRFRPLAKLVALILFAISSAISLAGALTTNQVPPRVEGIFLKMKYNFFLNFDYLRDNKSSSYFYNTFLAHHLPLYDFYFLILLSLLIFVSILLFFAAPFERHEH